MAGLAWPPEGGSELSFQRDILPLFRQSCATVGCHPEFVSHPRIRIKAKQIQARLNDKAKPMPPLGAPRPLKAEEQQRILAWIAAGSPNN